MSRRKPTLTQAEQAQVAQAERDALRMLLAQAQTAEQALAVIDRTSALVALERSTADRNALETQRTYGAAMFVAYKDKAGMPADTDPRKVDFSAVRGALGIDKRPDRGGVFTPWHGVNAYQTLEQAWNIHQWAREDGLVTDAWRVFCADHKEQAQAWLGAHAAGLIGLAMFARRVQQQDKDGATMMPSSGTPAERKALLVARAVERGQAVIDKRATAATAAGVIADGLRDAVDNPSAARFVPTVPGLSSMTVAGWTKDERKAVIAALTALGDWDKPAPAADEQAAQVAAVTTLAEQAQAPAAPVTAPAAPALADIIAAAVQAALAAQTA